MDQGTIIILTLTKLAHVSKRIDEYHLIFNNDWIKSSAMLLKGRIKTDKNGNPYVAGNLEKE